MIISADDIVERYASDKFQIKVALISALPNFIGVIFLQVSATLSPYIQCEWNMSAFQVACTSSIFFVGETLGSVYWGKIGDLIGRKYSLLFVSFGCIYFSLLVPGSSTMFWFFLTRFFVGQCVAAMFIQSMVYGQEFIKCNRREGFTALILLNLAGGIAYANIVAYLTLNQYGWKIYSVFLAAPTLLILPILASLPESMRYLEVCGRICEILDLLQNMIQDDKSQISLPRTIDFKSKQIDNDDRGNVTYMLSNYTKKVVALCCTWVSIPLTAYGFTFLIVYHFQSMKNNKILLRNNAVKCTNFLSDKDLLGIIWLCLGKFFFTIIYFLLAKRFGRKVLLYLTFLTSLLIYFVMLSPIPAILMKILLFVGLGTNFAAFSYLYQYTIELFPTFVRSTALGFCATVGKIATIFTPFIFQDMIYWSFPSVMVLMSILTLISLISLCFLQETKELHLS